MKKCHVKHDNISFVEGTSSACIIILPFNNIYRSYKTSHTRVRTNTALYRSTSMDGGMIDTIKEIMMKASMINPSPDRDLDSMMASMQEKPGLLKEG